jgi:hypothetical protein
MFQEVSMKHGYFISDDMWIGLICGTRAVQLLGNISKHSKSHMYCMTLII